MAKHGHLHTYSELLNPLPKTIHDQETVNSRRDPFSYLENKRRLVIYDSSPIFQQIATTTMFHVVRNRDPDDVVEKRLIAFREKDADINARLAEHNSDGQQSLAADGEDAAAEI